MGSKVLATGIAWTLFVLQGAVTSGLAQSLTGVYDYGQERHGERRGDWTPTDWLAVVLLIMTISAGLVLSLALCYYVSKRESRTTYGNPLVAYI